MVKLESALADWQKRDATSQSAVDNCKEGLKTEHKRKKELTKSIEDVSPHTALLIFPLV